MKAPILLIAALLGALQITACTRGKSGDGGKGTGGDLSLVPKQLAPPMTQIVTYTNDQWQTAALSVQSLIHSNSDASLSIDARNQKILTAVRTSPYVYDAGLTSYSTVWVRLKDGTPIGGAVGVPNIIPDGTNPLTQPWGASNRRPSPSRREHSWLEAWSNFAAALGMQQAFAQVSTLFALPATQTAFVADIANLAPNAATKISTMLSSNRYFVTQIDNPKMSLLRTAVQNHGVVWYNSHGVYYVDDQGVEQYGVFTGDQLSPGVKCSDSGTLCAENREDVAAGRAFLGSVQFESEPNAIALAINGRFVARYWKFSTDSLVMMSACESMDSTFANQVMLDGLRSARAGTLLGWTNSVYSSHVERASSWFFDRVLGANQYLPATPKQRPFSANEVYDSMRKSGRDADPRGAAKLVLKQFSDKATILRPSIRNIKVDENNSKLTLYGEFGGQEGSVEISGPAATANWNSEQIEATVTANQKGDTIVKVGAVQSNAVPVTDWVGSFSAKQYAKYLWGNPGPTWEAACSRVHLRGDVHRFRINPDETPVSGTMIGTCAEPMIGALNLARDSVCSGAWGGTGTKRIGDIETTSTFDPGTEPLVWANSTSPPARGWFFTVNTIHTEEKKLRFNFSNFGSTPITGTTVIKDYSRPQDTPYPKVTTLPGQQFGFESVGGLGCALASQHPLSLDPTTYSLPATSLRNFAIDCNPGAVPPPVCPGIPVGSGSGYNNGETGDVDIQLNADPATIPDSDTES